jgi:SAM-dependent methyltransferase
LSSLLVKLIGFPATLIHGDTLVLDRWLWLKRCLSRSENAEKLLDVGCGSGAFTIGAALRGYDALGLSWDERNQQVAAERAQICHARNARFEVWDARRLDERSDLEGQFDVAVCCEVIEHILDDRKLMRDISRCLKPDGRLFLTTPNSHYRPITREDNGPFVPIESGGHVRKGYTREQLNQLCEQNGLRVEHDSACSGFLSQKITSLLRGLSRIHPWIGWGMTLPLRVFPPVFDRAFTSWLAWPQFSLCLEARKLRNSADKS